MNAFAVLNDCSSDVSFHPNHYDCKAAREKGHEETFDGWKSEHCQWGQIHSTWGELLRTEMANLQIGSNIDSLTISDRRTVTD